MAFWRMPRLSLKRLTRWLPLLMLIPLWVGSFLVSRHAERALIEDIHERLAVTLHTYQQHLQTVLDGQERNLTLFASGAIRNRARGPAGATVPRLGWDYLSKYVPEAVGCLAYDLTGRQVAHTGAPGQPPPFAVREPVPVDLTEPRVTDPTIDPTDPSSRSTYDIFFPLIASEQNTYGALVGTLVCRVTNILSQTLSEPRRELGETGEVYLVSAKTGLMLTGSRFLPNVIGRVKVDTVGVRRALEAGEIRALYADYRGVPVMGVSLALPQYGWVLLAEMDEAEALAPVGRLRVVLGSSVAFVSLAAGLLGWWYGRQVEASERIETELGIASEIQRSILPRIFPPFPNRHEFDLYAETIPAREMGGDFFDFFFLDQDRLGLVIADVSGKGVPAAVFMAVTCTLLRATAPQATSPGQCLYRVNNMLCPENDAAMFVTVFYGILNTRTGDLEYGNAGHNLPYILSAPKGVTMLEHPGGPALGVIPDTPYPLKRVRLRPGDGLFLYTDGVTEAMDSRGTLFTDKRLQQFLVKIQERTPVDLIRDTVAEVRAHAAGEPQTDDITLLTLRYLREGGGARRS